MVRSMTGYGKAEEVIGVEKVVVDLRALNSKQLDINLKMPSQIRDMEIEVRNILSEKLTRGKVEVNISIEGSMDKKAVINTVLAAEYHRQLTGLASELSIDLQRSDLLGQIMRMPEVLQTERSEVNEHQAQLIIRLIEDACGAVNTFRMNEGKSLTDDLRARCANISALQEKIRPLIEVRIPGIRERIQKNLEQFLDGKDVDKNRFEQELIFYIEKYDVSEEMIRLAAHCEYFMETLDSPEDCGKKLGFISQEIGREINTLGAKSYDAEMQRHVVVMKDELEKIKEQVLNVL
ncbi:MAG: YicC family protein [Bacteroidetes bacterium]|nr:YicC family protein [Bacteroidota bacterium]MDA0973918.1 YicC family protein [Bacteroidota bacterium]